jgi:hypothetical protein
MKEFTSAAKAAVSDDDEDIITFKVDDAEVRAYPPSPGQLAMMFTSMGDYSTDPKKIAGVIDFILGLLDEDSSQLLGARLMDRRDPFELDQLTAIMEWLVEEWSARPTQPSPASTPSRSSTGRRSTGSVHKMASTRSVSPSVASAT